jgi:hypothetical protein
MYSNFIISFNLKFELREHNNLINESACHSVQSKDNTLILSYLHKGI